MSARENRQTLTTIPVGTLAGPPTLPVHVSELRTNRRLLYAGLFLVALIALLVLIWLVAFITKGGPDEAAPPLASPIPTAPSKPG